LLPWVVVRVRLGDAPADAAPPFTEDRAAAGRFTIVRELGDDEIAAFVTSTRAPSVRDLFGAPIRVDPGNGKDWYVAAGEGERSLGTVQVAEMGAVTARRNREAGYWEFRMSFQDASGETYKLPLSDLTAETYFALLATEGRRPQEAGRMARETLRDLPLHLRVALAAPTPAQPKRCYLHISNVIAGPDAKLLDGPHPLGLPRPIGW
ncbi:MAG: hypothetical protein QM692_24415, partial [Thermomicrobiales bacterium]